jgi:hypothetical protein
VWGMVVEALYELQLLEYKSAFPIKARKSRHYGVSEIIALYEQLYDGNLPRGEVAGQCEVESVE